jgi:hypothetical protein
VFACWPAQADSAVLQPQQQQHDSYLPSQHLQLLHEFKLCRHFVDMEKDFQHLLREMCSIHAWLKASEKLKEEDTSSMTHEEVAARHEAKTLAAKVNHLLIQIGGSRCSFCKKKSRDGKFKDR